MSYILQPRIQRWSIFSSYAVWGMSRKFFLRISIADPFCFASTQTSITLYLLYFNHSPSVWLTCNEGCHPYCAVLFVSEPISEHQAMPLTDVSVHAGLDLLASQRSSPHVTTTVWALFITVRYFGCWSCWHLHAIKEAQRTSPIRSTLTHWLRTVVHVPPTSLFYMSCRAIFTMFYDKSIIKCLFPWLSVTLLASVYVCVSVYVWDLCEGDGFHAIRGEVPVLGLLGIWGFARLLHGYFGHIPLSDVELQSFSS